MHPYLKLAVIFIVVGVFFMVPDLALAADPKPIQGGAEALFDLLTGKTARVIAAISVIAVGMMGYFNVLPLVRLLTVFASIVLIWGATTIVTWIVNAAN